jgi:hypothetical protein
VACVLCVYVVCICDVMCMYGVCVVYVACGAWYVHDVCVVCVCKCLQVERQELHQEREAPSLWQITATVLGLVCLLCVRCFAHITSDLQISREHHCPTFVDEETETQITY